MVYIDMRKAFDTINHDQLISKLQWFGVADNLLLWFATYLTDRPNAVVCKCWVRYYFCYILTTSLAN